jgi:Peptidase family M28
VPARGTRERTLVLVAHHDAAQTGVLWASSLAQAGRNRAARTGRAPSAAAGSEVAFGLVLAGSLAGSRLLRLGGAGLLGLGAVLALDVSRNETVPGASDNASGVAATLALAGRFAREPLEHTEVVALLTGCEESGMGGMAAWLAEEGRSLDPGRTLVVGLDTLGAGQEVVASGEGPLRTERYDDRDLAWVERGAKRAELPRTPRFRPPGWTDPVLARIAGLPAVSILSIREGGFTNYHLPTDTPDRIDWASVRRCTLLAQGIAEAFDSGVK